MPDNYRRIVLAILLGLMIVPLVFRTANAQDESEIPPVLLAQMNGIEEATAILRDLDPLSAIEHDFPTRQETIDYLEDVYDRELPQAEIERTTAFYVALSLLPPDIDLRQVYLDLLGSQVAGFYDPDTKTMNVIPLLGESADTGMSLTEQIIYSHEYTHALQDMHFDLNSILTSDLGLTNPDRALAITSLVEGDATVVMQLYLQEAAANNPMAALSILAEGALTGTLLPPSGVPDILLSELTFPYEQGLAFVTTVWGDGGWDAVNLAYVNLPTTSEQIMHPAKYIAGEGAQSVELGDLTPGDGWEVVWDTTLGEFYLRAHLREYTQYDTAASRAAAGWGGDALRIWKNGDALAFALKLVWDTSEDAQEFAEIYAESGAFSPDCATTAVGVLCAMQAGGASIIVLAPDKALADQLMAEAAAG